MASKQPLVFDRGLGVLLLEKENDPDEIGEAAIPFEETPSDIESEPEPVHPEAPVSAQEREVIEDGKIDSEIVVIEDVEIFTSFIQESQDHLANIEEKILNLESNRDTELVNEIFRSMHTIKGTSSFFGLEKIKELSHGLESTLDSLRAESISISPELVDSLLVGTDLLVHMIDDLGARVSDVDPGASSVEVLVPDQNISTVLNRLSTFESESGDQQELDSPPEMAVDSRSLITPEMVESFISEAREMLDLAEREILTLEKSPENADNIDGAFRAIHTLKGNAGFLGFDEIEKICMSLESSLDAVRTRTESVRPKTITLLLNTIDSMNKLVGDLPGPDADAPVPGETNGYKPLGELLIDLGEATEDVVRDALEKQEMKLGEILLSEGAVSENGLEKALVSQQLKNPGSSSGSQGNRDRKDIRVDMAKLDKMFDLMGELITAEAMVIHNPEIQHIESFNTAAVYLNKITREMQEITMAVRMIPLDGLFNKMKRLVRDLSRKFGKKVELSISGQDTEMDRNIIEQISDPLIHIIRNSIDHGIEDTGERSESGKPEEGNIHLGAKYEGNEIWITVRDDGRGLNRNAIVESAIKKGLLKAEADSIPDNEIWQLLFEPGFSTAEKVSEISGRGVGMDVVKKNIESLRGKIAIDTTPGEGTEFVLKIPLTLAIMDGTTFTVGDVLYAIPLGDILEFYKASSSDVTQTNAGRQVLKLRDEIIPVIKLHEFFGTNTEKGRIEDGIVIVVQANDRKAALLADDIAGYQQIVVKALPDYLGVMRAISGCSILGNGEVSLIVDTGSLLRAELE